MLTYKHNYTWEGNIEFNVDNMYDKQTNVSTYKKTCFDGHNKLLNINLWVFFSWKENFVLFQKEQTKTLLKFLPFKTTNTQSLKYTYTHGQNMYICNHTYTRCRKHIHTHQMYILYKCITRQRWSLSLQTEEVKKNKILYTLQVITYRRSRKNLK